MKKVVYLLLLVSASARVAAQAPVVGTGNNPPPVIFTAEQDHQNMMDQLGIKTLRQGPDGNNPNAANAANYDESLANPYPNLPDVMTMKNGKKVTTAKEWWDIRRPEIVEDMDREVYGRLPKNIPKITWTVKILDREVVSRVPVIAKQIIGHVDNSSYPAINVDIKMTVVLPANAPGPVPVLIMFSPFGFPAPSVPTAAQNAKINAALKQLLINADPSLKAVFEEHPLYQPFTPPAGPAFAFGAPPPPKTPDVPGVIGVNNDPPSTDQLIADGWGYVNLDLGSIQEDKGDGLTRGIIGLVNKGQPRKPDDWGALRAWGWGANEVLNYLEANEPTADAKHVGVEGVSRYGKAALVALAYNPKIAMALVGSSGEGGAKLNRRNWGEAVESLTGGEYYWMAGNFIKYGASEAKFGSKNAGDLPVDSHELIAMCAPRLTFISYGVPEKGDAKWLDHQGSYMAAIAAGPVFKLLGAKDLGVSNDYKTEKMPPVNTPMLDGQLAWRQHDQGHEDHGNMKWFIKWVDQNIGHKAPVPPGRRAGGE